MSKVAISEEYLTDIADSIREKLNSQDTYKVSEMSEAIDSITGGGGDIDWSAIGYESTPQIIVEGYNYAVEIKNNWQNVADLTDKFNDNKNIKIMPLVDTSNATTMNGMFYNSNIMEIPLLNTENVKDMISMFYSCVLIETIPLLNTSKCEKMGTMFLGCRNLKNVPILNTSKLYNSNSLSNTFGGCLSLTDESLDNILQMCINATIYRGTKTLAKLGFSATYYSASRIQALTHYQDFINAGWTIGY